MQRCNLHFFYDSISYTIIINAFFRQNASLVDKINHWLGSTTLIVFKKI